MLFPAHNANHINNKSLYILNLSAQNYASWLDVADCVLSSTVDLNEIWCHFHSLCKVIFHASIENAESQGFLLVLTMIYFRV